MQISEQFTYVRVSLCTIVVRHRTVQIIILSNLQTIIGAQMLSVGEFNGQRDKQLLTEANM